MKMGKSTGVQAKQWEPIEKAIARFYLEEIYRPLIAELKAFNIPIENAAPIDPVIDALKKGTLYYERGKFYGSYNSRLSKALKGLGAKYDAKRKVFTLPQAKLPPDVSMATVAAQARISKLNNTILDKLASLDIADRLAQYDLPYLRVVKDIHSNLSDAVASLGVKPKLTPEMAQAISDDWSNNLKLYIKDWADENILKLREQVAKNAFAGNRGRDLEKLIMKSYGASQSKARFLAWQETSLLYSKMREERYKDVGTNRYKWVTNMDGREREEHAELNGKVFSWDAPPIIDKKGNRGHPGEAFGCRCRARPILD